MRIQRTSLALIVAAIGVALVLSLPTRQTPVAAAGPSGTSGGFVVNQQIIGSYIVVYRNNVDAPSYTSSLAKRFGFTAGHVFKSALRGFSAALSDQAVNELRSDPNVAFVEQDSIMRVTDTLPTGIKRIQADQNTTGGTIGLSSGKNLSGDNLNVAIIDTGVTNSTGDLNILGGFAQYYGQQCFGRWCFGAQCAANTSSYADQYGHGTHVAGTITARNNGSGVVGVAPGTGIYSVRVLGPDGSGCTSDVIAGVDWVTQHAAQDHIAVANMSLGGGDSPALCSAINDATNAGVVFAVAAGNSGADASNTSPANCTSAITVAAIADYDGQPGHLASPTCANYGSDDSLASFSNYGSVVDIAAPGVCIQSTVPTNCGTSICNSSGLNTLSGTSMATPHVAGAALLDILQQGWSADSSRTQNVLDDLISTGFTQNGACGYNIES